MVKLNKKIFVKVQKSTNFRSCLEKRISLRCISKHRNQLLPPPAFLCFKTQRQKYFGKVSFWPMEYTNRPPKFPLFLISRMLVSFKISHETGKAFF